MVGGPVGPKALASIGFAWNRQHSRYGPAVKPAPLGRCLPLAFLLPMLASSLPARAADAPAAPPPLTVRVVNDVTFLASDRAEKLDLYLPEGRAPGTLSPAVVWIHGGGWIGGTKSEARAKEICPTFAQAGYVVVSIDYKLGPGSWPLDLLDSKNAVRFLRSHAKEYQIDPDRIAVAGGSAGGHLALMVAFTQGKKEFEPAAPYPGVSDAVRAVIDLYGPVELPIPKADQAENPPTGMRKLMADALAVFGAKTLDAEVLRTASPTLYAAKGMPPVLIFHGKADTTVDHEQSEILDRVLQERGIEHEFILLDGVGHSFDFEHSGQRPLPRDLRPIALAFLTRHLDPEVKAASSPH
jgi:acetyl esterase/lipase